jgi:MFS family permease
VRCGHGSLRLHICRLAAVQRPVWPAYRRRVTSPQPSSRSRWTLVAVSTALFCVQIDYFAMNLAVPRMAHDLGSSATDLQWVISIYMLSLGAFMVPAGRIGDIFGRRRALLVGIALFGVASVLCAVAPTAPMVIAFRALQGLGSALIFPVSLSVLTNAFPARRASQAIGMAYGIAGLGNAAGPLIGGLLTDTLVPAAGGHCRCVHCENTHTGRSPENSSGAHPFG